MGWVNSDVFCDVEFMNLFCSGFEETGLWIVDLRIVM